MADNELRDLLRQREALDREITQRQGVTTAVFNNHLDTLDAAVRAFAEQHVGWSDERRRKNVVSIVVGQRITVRFAYIEPQYSGFLALWDSETGMRCEFSDVLPVPAALLGLLAGQLGIGTFQTGSPAPAH